MIRPIYELLLYWMAGGTVALLPISQWLRRAAHRDPALQDNTIVALTRAHEPHFGDRA